MAHELPMKSDEKWMSEALDLAKAALKQGEFPVGAVLVAENGVIGRGVRINSRQEAASELDHAEILAIRDMYGSAYFKNTSCEDRYITAYVTLEPCLMCLGALLINGVRRIVFAYEDIMGGACGFVPPDDGISLCRLNAAENGMIGAEKGLYAGWIAVGRVLRAESLALFKAFFRSSGSDYLRNTLLERYTLEAH